MGYRALPSGKPLSYQQECLLSREFRQGGYQWLVPHIDAIIAYLVIHIRSSRSPDPLDMVCGARIIGPVHPRFV